MNTKPIADNPPKSHLIVSEGKWAVLHQGMPLCAPTDETTARKCADKFRLTLSPFIWDGDKGSFVAVES